MKKVKVMMTAIAVLAVVGGALAFKARTFGTQFCTKATAGGPGTCAATIYTGKVDQSGSNTFYYTSTAVNDCARAQCQVSTALTSVEP